MSQSNCIKGDSHLHEPYISHISVSSGTKGEDGYVSDAAADENNKIQHLEQQINLLNNLVNKLKVEVNVRYLV